MIKVSIIITSHNKEKYLGRAINSCINQDFLFKDFEIIIVDDASTDKSREIISVYDGYMIEHNFIRSKFLKKNRGVAYASNVGIKMARGKYIVRVDGDDYIHKDFLKVMSEVLDWNLDIGFVYCDLVTVKKTGTRKFQLNTFERLLNHGAGVMFRKIYLSNIGMYNERLRNCEDYDLILRYNQKYERYHLRLPYYRYFKHGEGLSSNIKEREKLKKQIKKSLNIKIK
jgi:glycosyltransferase involved in cell wall biosynthesis